MAASRDLPFPLVIICLLFIRGYFSLPTASRVTGAVPTRPLSPGAFLPRNHNLASFTEDYGQLEDTVTPDIPIRETTRGGPSQRCQYNSCLENQVSCAELAASTGCLCPGLTLYNEVPEPPKLKSVAWNGSEVVIQWCAPNSFVTAYTVTVGGQEQKTFGKGRRSGALGDIDHVAEVCVMAVNDRGASKGSCTMYHPRDNSLLLKAGLIGGALGFLLLLLLGVLLWRHKRQRK